MNAKEYMIHEFPDHVHPQIITGGRIIVHAKYLEELLNGFYRHKLSEITEEVIKERFYKELTYTQRITKGDEVSIMPTRFKRGPEQVLDWVLNLLKGES